jgi:diguanylate cyclase (GGDEF)-like protein
MAISLALLMSVIAIVLGVVRHRPVRAWPWWLLACALAVEVVAAFFTTRLPASASPFDWSVPLGAAHLAGALMATIAQRDLLFRRMPPHDRDAAVDAVIVALVVGLLIWVLGGAHGGFLVDVTLVGGVVLLLMLAVFGAVLRIAFSGLLALGAIRWLVAMIVLLLIGAVWTLSDPRPEWALELVWSTALLGPGMAALSPSMRELSMPAAPVGRDAPTLARTRMVLLGAGVVAVPLAVMLEHGLTVGRHLVVSIGLLVMSLAVAWRMVTLVRQRDAAAAELARANVELEHLAGEDALTGLANRRRFQHVLDEALTARHTTRVALVLVDLDRFKLVNDGIGHTVGDQLLIAVARRLDSAVRAGDTPARLGGDEFAVICPDVADHGVAREIAARVAEALNGVYEFGNHRYHMSGSVGVAVAHRGDVTASELLRNADVAMYRAKQRGGARVELYSRALDDRSVRRLELSSALNDALERDELMVVYQPEVDLRDGAVLWAEALIRWRHPTYDVLPPDEFLHIAEETGAIIPIGRWVLRQACAQLVRWREDSPQSAPVTIAVNVSAQQLSDPQLVGAIRDALARTGLDPKMLWLEITETSIMREPQLVAETLDELKRLGVGLALDDFGTGYSSLAHIKHFPLDALKIDRSFVSGMTRNPHDRMIVSAVVSLAHALGLLAVAEGVETDEQLAELRHLGCDFGQGYLWSKPMDPDAFTVWMNDNESGRSRGPHAARNASA